MLAAREHYLASGGYPKGHWAKPGRGQRAPRDAPVGPMAVAERPVSRSAKTITTAIAKPQMPSRARELVAEVIAAGGELHRESKNEPSAFSSLVAAVNRHQLAPEGKQLTLDTGGRWSAVVIRLEAAPYWLTAPVSAVVAADRIAKWHPAVVPLRDHDFTSMSAPMERRMLRILQALAVEAEWRGHRVEPTRPRRGYHHRQSEAGHVAIAIRGYRYTIAVWQKYREVPPPRWGKPAKRPDADSRDALAVGLIWESGGRSGISQSWSDSPPKHIMVENLLPKILWEIERRSDRADQRQEQERLAAIERERIQAEAARRAAITHAENVRAETLRAQHARWREAIELREYLAAMDDVIADLTDTASSEGDPISGPVAMRLGVGGSWSTVERTGLG